MIFSADHKYCVGTFDDKTQKHWQTSAKQRIEYILFTGKIIGIAWQRIRSAFANGGCKTYGYNSTKGKLNILAVGQNSFR